MTLLRRVEAGELRPRRYVVQRELCDQVTDMLETVRVCGDAGLDELRTKYDGLSFEAPRVLLPADFERAAQRLAPEQLELLRRVARRIERFARAQQETLAPLQAQLPSASAGQTVLPIAAAGCYAPGGRFPLPSSLLMSACTARVAGVPRVVGASPKADDVMLAAAHVAGADEFLVAGGAQAIAALAYGTESIAAVDFICGPGNRWVTEAKRQVVGQVGIDMLAGPSELVVIADEGADPRLVALDLLAQAEHDDDALPILISWSERLIDDVETALQAELRTSSSAIEAALRKGFAVLVDDPAQACAASDAIAPEHLQLCVRDAESLMQRIQHAGTIFVGERVATVHGDYGIGPNHVLPTSAAARYRGGLSVFDFLRVRTWVSGEAQLATAASRADAEQLAELEGLSAHARALAQRGAAPPLGAALPS